MKNTILIMCLGAALALATVPANAAVQVNDIADINLVAFIPCADGGAGEVVNLSGPLHVVITFTINGNNISGVAHFQPQGITGTGETTGDKYQSTGVTKNIGFKTSFQNGQATQSFVNNFKIIGAGPDNNLLIHVDAQVTFNANGTVTVSHNHFSAECR